VPVLAADNTVNDPSAWGVSVTVTVTDAPTASEPMKQLMICDPPHMTDDEIWRFDRFGSASVIEKDWTFAETVPSFVSFTVIVTSSPR
jgi:hypothetical protein